VLQDFVAGAYRVLRPRGALYMVFNRLPSLSRDIEAVFGNVEVVARSKGFVVVRAVKQPREREREGVAQ
jgi:16S rRNA G1207 methylase RsmC